MSDQNNVELIRKVYAAFGAGDVQTILNSVAEDAEWVNHGPDTIPYAGSRSGKAQVLEFFKAIADTTTGGKVVAETYIAQGDNVVAIGSYRATVRNTGAEIDTPVAHIFTVRGGKIVRWEGFSDTARVAAAHTGKSATAR
jgi:ketosteroid isomerase-like protein